MHGNRVDSLVWRVTETSATSLANALPQARLPPLATRATEGARAQDGSTNATACTSASQHQRIGVPGAWTDFSTLLVELGRHGHSNDLENARFSSSIARRERHEARSSAAPAPKPTTAFAAVTHIALVCSIPRFPSPTAGEAHQSKYSSTHCRMPFDEAAEIGRATPETKSAGSRDEASPSIVCAALQVGHA